MSSVNKIKTIALMTAVTLASVAGLPRVVLGQDPQDPPAKADGQDPASKKRPRTTENPATPKPTVEPDQAKPTPSDVPQDTQPNRQEQASEENIIVQSYNNFFNSYRLGPEDVISVTVFGQDRYSRSGIIIPPSGRISLALIPGGLFVNGKTTEDVEQLIKKRYDEYIIDPQVTVSLDKASSYRYSIIGDIAQPGIKLMSRRLTVTEAIAEAGGVLPTGSKSRIVVLRKQANGILGSIPVDVSAIYKGRAPDSTYLSPGDQIVVPGNKLKTFQKIMSLVQVIGFARIFTGL